MSPLLVKIYNRLLMSMKKPTTAYDLATANLSVSFLHIYRLLAKGDYG